MVISSTTLIGDTLPQTSPDPAETAQRRQMIQAARSINESGILGRNQIVFLIDPATRRPLLRVEDRETHEVLLQLPPEYVLRMAQDIKFDSAQIASRPADT
jgi:uncharacterized FlaG/YvyC family protein